MRNGTLVVATAALALLPGHAWAQGATAPAGDPTARSIMETMRRKQVGRWSRMDTPYVLATRTGGILNVVLMEKVSDEAGFRIVPPPEIQSRLELEAGLNPNTRRVLTVGMAAGVVKLGGLASRKLGGEAGATTHGLVEGAAFFYAAALDYPEMEIKERQEFREAAGRDLAEVARRVELLGQEEVHGRPAHHLGARELARRLPDNFTLQELDLWVDTTTHVPLRLRMVGDYRDAGQVRRVTIQRDDWDYRPVGALLEPHQQRLQLSGLLGPRERAELVKSKIKLAEFEARLAAMPEAQRKQLEGMLGSQLETMRRMVNEGGDIDVLVDLRYRVGGLESLAAMLAAEGTGN